jgi:hypothetical protein
MPDLSQYSPEKPYVPQQFSKVNLSDAFVPRVELPNVSDVNAGTGTNVDDPWTYLLRTTGRNPFAGMGIVPAGPAAMTDYWSNRKFTSEADSYQSGNTYRDIGFLIGRDNENLFAKNRSFWDESFNTIVRLLDKAGGYTAQGFGFLGGLIGIGNKANRYDNGSGFANWIAGASDNGLAQWGAEFTEDVDNIYRPIYQDAEDKNKGFFRRMLTDAEFWKGEVTDGVAFLLSAYAGSNLGKILDVGGKVVRGSASLRGLNYADNAAAFSDEGLTGLSETTNLSRGGATMAAETGAPLVPNTLSSNAGRVYSQFLQEAGNFSNARKINMGVSTLINTASESMFEASSLKNELAERLSEERNVDGSYKYTSEQVKSIAANAAKNSFLMNMIVLPISNLWETKLFYGRANPLSARNAGNSLVRREAGLLSNAEIAKRTFGQKALDYLKGTGEGIFKEGLWEENIQLAIERINHDPENMEEGFFHNIGRVLNQYANQTFDALSGNDTEASMNIGIGGLIGAGGGIRNAYSDIKAVKRDVANYNNSINAFRTSARDLYEKNPDGSVRMDENGQPVINPTNVLSYISSLNKTLNMTELADNLKDRNMNILHSIVDNENVARLVKAYADNGMVDDLLAKLDDAKGYKVEDLMLLGLNPDKNSVQPRLDALKQKALDYKSIYDNIEKNFIVRLRKDDRNGSKARLMKEKLYYLSTRAANLQSLRNQVIDQRDQKTSEMAGMYTSPTDSLVDELNELVANFAAAKKRVGYLSTQQRTIENERLYLEDSETETIPVGDGVSVTKKKSKKKTKPAEQFTAVDEQELSDAVTSMTQAETALTDYINTNKETLKNIKRNADGTYRYEIDEKNRLMYDSGAVKDRNVAKDLEMARNATLNVFNRISDIKYGERYFDEVYGRRQRDLNRQVENDESQIIDENLEDEDDSPSPENPTGPATPGVEQEEPVTEGPTFRSKEEWDEGVDELNQLKREKETLEGKEDATIEEDVRLDEVNRRIDELEGAITSVEQTNNEYTVQTSSNIPDASKEDYRRILNEIAANKRKVTKRDGFYEIDGERYGKVSDLIGNVVPEDMRPALQNALTAGYTVDSIVKAYFEGGLNEDFKREVATKISEEALNKLIKQLDAISRKLREEGVEIVANNVVVYDTALKVAGEIDLLAVDKNGNFKIYEIEARQGRIWAQIATKTGRGPAIYDITQKQLSAYRNLFANQYGSVPGTISVMFPIDVKYDKESPTGFIEKVNLKPEIRYVPTANITIKSAVFQPVKTGSKYDGFDMTSLYINTFIPKTMESAKEKLRFLLRNVPFDQIKKKLTLTVRPALAQFQERFDQQKEAFEIGESSEYKITKFPGFDNLYSLVGNKEMAIEYEGTLLGYMQPSPTLAYKDANGRFQILDEATPLATYKVVTNNSEQTYSEFTNIARAYKNTYQSLVDQLGENKEIVIPNQDVQKMFDIQMSYGELDLVKTGQARPDLGELVVNGVKVGNKSVMTVVHLDDSNAIRVFMDKNTRTRNTGKKYFEMDVWANRNVEKILEVMNNLRGEKVTDYAAIIELPNGTFQPIALRLKKDANINQAEDYIPDMGTKFTASTSKNVFKNESVSLIPKKNTIEAAITLRGNNIISEVYPTQDVTALEKAGLDIQQAAPVEPVDTVVNNFVKSLSEDDFKKVNSMFAAYTLTAEELNSELIDDFNAGSWSSINDYLEQLKCDM